MRTSICLLIGLFLTACQTTDDTRVSYDSEADFSKFKTYEWVTDNSMMVLPGGNGETRSPTPETQAMIRASIDRKLAEMGFRKASPADFAVGYLVGVRDKERTKHWGPYASDLPRYGSHPMMQTYSRSDHQSPAFVRKYTEGELSVDIYDAKSKRAVWSNWTNKQIYEGETVPVEKVVNEAVAEVLSKFPPKGKN